MNAKVIITLVSLFALGNLSHSNEAHTRKLGALYIVDVKPIQVPETGAPLAAQLRLDRIRKKDIDLKNYRKITVIGSVSRSGVYFSEKPILLLDLIDLAGYLKEENGAGSHRNISVLSGSSILIYDINRLREMKIHGDQKYKVYLNGGEVVIRHHSSGL